MLLQNLYNIVVTGSRKFHAKPQSRKGTQRVSKTFSIFHFPFPVSHFPFPLPVKELLRLWNIVPLRALRRQWFMQRTILILITLLAASSLKAQRVDSIYFHLYTDSLKKGTHNYINVDGKLSNGRWQPLTSKELQFSSSAGEFSGNDLVVPAEFKAASITVKAVLRSNPAIWKETTIWIKTLPDPDILPTKEEILKSKPKKKSRNN